MTLDPKNVEIICLHCGGVCTTRVCHCGNNTYYCPKCDRNDDDDDEDEYILTRVTVRDTNR